MTDNDRITPWITASDSGGTCFELRRNGDKIEVRDSKDPDRVLDGFTPAELEAFLRGAKAGTFDGLL